MRILIVTQYFWPEQFIVNSLATELTEYGYDVEVLTGLPNYPDGLFFKGYGYKSVFAKGALEKVLIHRVPILPRFKNNITLLLNYVSFVFCASVWALINKKRRYDIIFCYAPSPITSALPASFIRYLTGAPLVLWVQDLWPETLSALGVIKNKFLLNTIGKVVKFIYRHTDVILSQTNAFKASMIFWGAKEEQVHFVPNWADPFVDAPEPEWVRDIPTGFKIGFAGNIGKAQDMQTLLRAAELVKKQTEKKIVWVVVGDGSEKKYLESETIKRGLGSDIFFVGRRPYNDMLAFFNKCDVLYVSLLDKKIFELTIPAKVQAYMSAGRPLLASLAGEGRKVIEEANCGFVAPPERPELLAKLVCDFINLNIEKREEMGSNAQKFFENNFERKHVINKILDILKAVKA